MELNALSDAIDSLSHAIDRLAQTDPCTFADADSLVALEREVNRLDAFVTSVVGAFDTSEIWALDGARNASSWIATRCRMPKGEARSQVRRARTLQELESTGAAWATGDLGRAHVDAIGSLHRPATAEALGRDEHLLVEQARALTFKDFTRALTYWEQLADPDGVEVDARALRDGRHVSLDESLGGCWLGSITLDPIGGAIVGEELERLERTAFEADWAEAEARLERRPAPGELARTPGQRRADALVEMATRSNVAPLDGKRPAPLFSVLVGYETLHGRICELARGTVITPGALLPWLDEAYIERAVFDVSGRVEVSSSARLFTGATRRALELRDGRCTHPFCDQPADRCQGDHITPFAVGGPTTQDNGRLLCGYHHRLRTERPPPRSPG
jgi:hypothetical protein